MPFSRRLGCLPGSRPVGGSRSNPELLKHMPLVLVGRETRQMLSPPPQGVYLLLWKSLDVCQSLLLTAELHVDVFLLYGSERALFLIYGLFFDGFLCVWTLSSPINKMWMFVCGNNHTADENNN